MKKPSAALPSETGSAGEMGVSQAVNQRHPPPPPPLTFPKPEQRAPLVPGDPPPLPEQAQWGSAGGGCACARVCARVHLWRVYHLKLSGIMCCVCVNKPLKISERTCVCVGVGAE